MKPTITDPRHAIVEADYGCKNCRHWRRPRKDLGDGAKGECRKAESESGKPIAPQTLAVAQDAEGYAAYLTTAPSFFCIQYSRRQP